MYRDPIRALLLKQRHPRPRYQPDTLGLIMTLVKMTIEQVGRAEFGAAKSSR